MDTFKILKLLAETAGPSGYEQAVATVIEELWQPYVDEIVHDRVGSLIGIRYGQAEAPRRRLLLAAHMDEIGLMVKQIVSHHGNGFLRVTNVGGVDRRHLYGQQVIVHGKQSLVGVIGSLPSRMLASARVNKVFGYEDLVIDVGLPAEDVAEQVAVGDFVSFRQPLQKLMGKLVTGKSLDNRASVTAVTLALEALTSRQHRWDVVAVATCQEETRLLGGYTSSYAQRPDVAIAIDVTFGKGPGAAGASAFALNEGPTIGLGPNVHPGINDALHKAAKSVEMDVHTEIHTRASGTDAYGLQVARAGIPTGVISIPMRYMHTMVETISLTDIERVGRLLTAFVTQLDDQFIEQLTAGLMETE